MRALRVGQENRSSGTCGLVLTAVLGMLLSIPDPADAATITVDTTVDDTTVNGNCTLREAVIAANTDSAVDACAPGSGADDIVVPAGTYVLTLVGAGEDAAATGDLDLTDDVDITGAGEALTIINGNDTDRVFDVDPAAAGVAATISAVTVANGRAPSGGGGGIRNQGTLAVSDSTVRNNEALPDDPEGGGIKSGSGGSLAISNSTIGDNIAGPGPGGFAPAGFGGGIFAINLTLVGSTVTGNEARVGGGPVASPSFGGGMLVADSLIINSTITNNGVGFSPFGGGIMADATVTLLNSTVSHNRVSGIGVIDPTLIPATVILRNTIVAQNEGVDCGVFFGGPFPSVANAYNLDSDNTCGLSGTDLPSVDPLLGPLQHTGGPTATRALLPGSPAIDAGNPAAPGSGGTACEATDQRGVVRPQGLQCDIGAHEGPCGDGVADPGEQCGDDGLPTGGCCVLCAIAPNGFVCRGDAGACDVQEVCDGLSASCPANVFEPADTPCGSSLDDQCTNPDTCNALGVCLGNHEPDGTSCADGNFCTVDDQCTDGVCGGSGPCPLNHYLCYQGRDLREPKFAKTMVTLTDQIITNEMVEVQKLKYVCTPVSKAGEGIIDPDAHLSCYQIKAPNLSARPQLHVSTQFQESRFEAKKAKLLCMPSTKTLVP